MISRMNLRMNLQMTLAFLCTLLASLDSLASAQEQSANDILDASRIAIEELSGFSAQFRMKGEGGSLFADTLPSMGGQLFFGTHDEYGRVIHCIGEARDQQKSPSQAIDILIAQDRYLWTDTKTQTINERPIASSTRGLPSAFPLVLINSIIADDPFAKDADNADEIKLLAQDTVADTLCDVIHIKRTKPNTRAKRSGADAYTDARWYIGVDDRLPRKVEHITDAGLVKITLLFELSNLRIIEPTQAQLDITRPEGFAFKSSMPKPDSAESPDQPIESDPQASSQPIALQPNQPTEPRITYAPPYAFTPDARSEEINNTTQQGRITVLYFWGSWCVPCKIASPLVSELAQRFEPDPVDVFGLAIREADPKQTRLDFASQANHHTLVLDADALTSSFKVRVFPTIVVIDQTGEIVFQKSITKELTSEDLVAEAKAVIEAAMK